MNDDAPEDRQLSLIEHLTELRQHLLRICVAVLGLFCGLLYFSNDIYHFIAQPLIEKLPAGNSMIATEVASPFLTPVKLTLFLAIFISMPYILYQFWLFIAPGLYRNEQRLAVPLIITSIILFYSGCGFAYFITLPPVFGFFTAVTPEGVMIMTDIQHYLRFVITLFFSFGLAFEIPIASYLLVRGDFVSIAQLEKNRPYVILFSFVLGMLLTPPDIISQILLAVPVWLLFELGLLFNKLVHKKNQADKRES